MFSGIAAKDLPMFQEPVKTERIIPNKVPKTPLTAEELEEIEEEAKAKIEQAKKDKAERTRQQRNSFLSQELNRGGFKTPISTPRPGSAVPTNEEVLTGNLLPPLDSARSDNGKKLRASSAMPRARKRKPSMSAPSSPRGRPRSAGMELIVSSSGGYGNRHRAVAVDALEEDVRVALQSSTGAGESKTRSRAGSQTSRASLGSRANSPRRQSGGGAVTPTVGGSIGILEDSQKSTDTAHNLASLSKSQRMKRLNDRRSFA